MIKNVSELLKAPGLVPRSESSRLADIRRNRRLLNGDFSQLETDFPVNLFSRVACFYPALLFSETPEITVPDYPRFEAFFEEIKDELLKQLLVASGDMFLLASASWRLIRFPLSSLRHFRRMLILRLRIN